MHVLRLICFCTMLPAFGAEWNPRLAADYLDARQKAWFDWEVAKAAGGPCISCHTGVPYLLARPALRRILAEDRPTPYETGLLNALRGRAGSLEPKDMFPAFTKQPFASQALGVESIFAALFLSFENRGPEITADSQKALDRLWPQQVSEGTRRGAWPWFSLGLDPYEMPDSAYFGATFAAAAVGGSPEAYRKRPEIRRRVDELESYLRQAKGSQPLHNRLFLLWASTRLPGLLSPAEQKAITGEAWARQNADGGWGIRQIGPWTGHPAAGNSDESSSYATAVVIWALSLGDIRRPDPSIARAAKWLASRQDRAGGFWAADSMNKKYPSGSMQEKFLQDAATAFASMALIQLGVE